MFRDFANSKVLNGNIAIGVVCIDGAILDLETWETLGLPSGSQTCENPSRRRERGRSSQSSFSRYEKFDQRKVCRKSVEFIHIPYSALKQQQLQHYSNRQQGLPRIDKEQEAQTLDYLKAQKS